MIAFLGTLEDLYADFQKLDLIVERIAFLKKYKKKNLPWDIKWDNLIKRWEEAAKDQVFIPVRLPQSYPMDRDEGENFDSME